MKQPLLKAGTVATIVHTLYPENNIKNVLLSLFY